MFINPDNEEIKRILQNSKTIAIVGLSDKPHRDSYMVAKYLQDNQYKIIPVNPKAKTVLGEKAYTNLLEISEKVDIVNVFRRSDQVMGVIEEALKIMPQAIWLQLGIQNQEGAELAASHDITMVMDKCIKVEHRKLLGMADLNEA